MVRIVNEIKNLKDLTKSLNNPFANLLKSKKNPREINIDDDSEEEIPLLESLSKSLVMTKKK